MPLLQTHITEILMLLFLVVTFFQSGIDKVTDWKGNVSFVKDHFKHTSIKNFTSLLLAVILVIEILAGALMFVGIFNLAITGNKDNALLGVELAALCLIFLLIGQRLAKDYVGAMSLTVYFILTIFCLYLLNK
ncbi:DoxX family membrane protein [Tenacibaculum sp. UWU-22]|uniref:DoxX family membrane protein n=1 Tax=Tenacibaculum sp. UWU-22 TaxID=3234187 RepID=UPI0034DB3729